MGVLELSLRVFWDKLEAEDGKLKIFCDDHAFMSNDCKYTWDGKGNLDVYASDGYCFHLMGNKQNIADFLADVDNAYRVLSLNQVTFLSFWKLCQTKFV